MNIRNVVIGVLAAGAISYCAGQTPSGFSQEPNAGNAIKAALKLAAERAIDRLSAEGGFSQRAEIRINLPPEADEMKKTLTRMGLEKQIDAFEADMNRAAERASSETQELLLNAIFKLSLAEAAELVRSENPYAATEYLKSETETALLEKIQPIIEQAMGGAGVMDSWHVLTSTYNKIPFTRAVETDLQRYLCEKTLYGIFFEMGRQERRIRQDPAARTIDLLNTFFGRP